MDFIYAIENIFCVCATSANKRAKENTCKNNNSGIIYYIENLVRHEWNEIAFMLKFNIVSMLFRMNSPFSRGDANGEIYREKVRVSNNIISTRLVSGWCRFSLQPDYECVVYILQT